MDTWTGVQALTALAAGLSEGLRHPQASAHLDIASRSQPQSLEGRNKVGVEGLMGTHGGHRPSPQDRAVWPQHPRFTFFKIQFVLW